MSHELDPQAAHAGHLHASAEEAALHEAGNFSRRNLLRFAAIGAAAASTVGFGEAVPASAAGWSDDLGTLKIGYLPITDAAPLLVAHGSKIFKKNGITTANPTLFRTWPSLVEAFQAKKVDVVHLLMPLALQLKFAANQDIKIISWNHTNGSALTVANSINKVTDLAGKVVAIPFWYSIHNVVLQQLFRKDGLTPVFTGTADAAKKEVKVVILAPADMPTALANGSVSGYIVAEPFNALAEVKGIGKILRFTGDVWKDHACCVTVVRGDLVKNNPQAAQAIADSIVAAQAQINQGRQTAAALLSDLGYLTQPVEAIQRALTYYPIANYKKAITNTSWASRRIGFQPFPFPTYTAALVTELRKTKVGVDNSFLNKINLKTVHADIVAVGLAEAAIKKNGGNKAFGLPTKLARTEVIKP